MDENFINNNPARNNSITQNQHNLYELYVPASVHRQMNNYQNNMFFRKSQEIPNNRLNREQRRRRKFK